ncbi:class I SAM-dependent methyltransferase [Anditalea andensis]|uniref:Methyltransferase type 11 n=1 Tax=Anditalea andensis TaxID=1048983 RepID=A0A074L3E3_9BACT|nr:class I SAM-dependent methyltransferase [Anditalea andensis]KEO75679.1 methyltransferase type 11 [Anditalea andensis]
MNDNIGDKYDKIAQWWHDYHRESTYGLSQIEKAMAYCGSGGSALDVGCGSGGRIINSIEHNGFRVTGIDPSAKMIALAKANHPSAQFHVADICKWDTDKKYNLIIAWDSIFHLPLSMHYPVLTKLCGMLQKNGVLAYTFGDGYGAHESDWQNDKFPYSTIGINGNLSIIMDCNCECRHLELDQYPEKHVFMIVRKN